MKVDKGKYLIIIAGPTAVGKTDLAIRLARALGTEIISADSRQCYREMNIGTAKPTEAELAAVPHHFINSHSVVTPLNASDFEKLALGYLSDIFSKHQAAIVCGGTGLYIKALCEGMDEMPAVPPGLAEGLQREWEDKGLAWLQERIVQEDPEFWKAGEIRNPARMLRALAFKRATGKSVMSFRSGNRKPRPFKMIRIGLELPRPVLYERINTRVNHMIKEGLLEEVRSLLPYRTLKNLNTVGYSELFDYLEGKIMLEQAIDLIRQHTRNYAKRQLTWFRNDPGWNWFRPDQPLEDFITLVDASMNRTN